MNEFEWHELKSRLLRSAFRAKFRLGNKDMGYLQEKGLETIRSHAEDFIRKRLSPAFPENDGKQTPFRNHPVFIAQHATATCCRNCLQKWHSIPKGKPLSDAEVKHVVDVIMLWLGDQLDVGDWPYSHPDS